MNIRFYLDNVEINPPADWQKLEFELNFERDKNNSKVTISEWNFVRENADKIHAWRNGGLIGGPGVFEGLPFKITVDNSGTTKTLFDGYLDLTEDAIYADKQYVTTQAKEKAQIDFLNDVAYGFGPEYLKKIGSITASDYIFMPYILSSVPNYRDSFIAVLGVYTVTMQLLQQVTELTNLVIAAANPFEGTALIRLIVQIAYIVVLLIALVKLLKDLVNLLIQPVKYHACMKVKTQLEKCAAFVGLNFSSEIFDPGSPFENLVILPEKYYVATNTGDNRILGFTSPNTTDQNGFYKGEFGDLLTEMKKMFCSKLVIKNDAAGNPTLYLLRRDKGLTPPLYQVPQVDERAIKLNTREFKSNYVVGFEVDLIDKNTIQEYVGTRFQTIITPATTTAGNPALMKGIENVTINFALAKTKKELTFPEKVVLEFLDVVSVILNGMIMVVNAGIDIYNEVAELINKIIDKLDTIGITINISLNSITPLEPVDFGELIDNRIGMLKIEQDNTGKQKLFILDPGTAPKYNKVHSSNETVVNASYLYNNYHFITSFIPSSEKPQANQWWEKDLKGISFTWQNYLEVLENNQCLNASTLDSEVMYIKWNPFNQTSNIKYRVNQLYSTNFIETKFSSDGS